MPIDAIRCCPDLSYRTKKRKGMVVNRVQFLAVVVGLGCVAQGLARAQDTTRQDSEHSQVHTPAESSDTMSISALRAQSLRALQTGDTATAVLAADAMMRQYPNDTRSMRLAGDIFLRTGKIEDAVKLFDRYIAAEPQQMPGLWQRGIALYFVGEYEKGAEQFEEHRKVNPHDVENAAWHFLCVAKSDTIETARKMVLPAPNDPRIPMKEVLEMLNTGDSNAIVKKMNSVPDESRAKADAMFYGNFYLGVDADARGELKQAHQFLARAAEDAPHHYMGDIARVYAERLAKSLEKR